MKHKKLTLIELIITIMVLGLLAALAIPQFTGVKANADVASFKNDIDTLTKAMDESYIKDDSLPLGEKVTITDAALLDAIYATGDSATNLYKIDLDQSKKYHSKLKTKINADSYFIYSMETGKVFYTKPVKDSEGQTLYTMEYIGLTNVVLGSTPLISGMSVPVTEPVQTITGEVPATATVEVKVNGTNLPVTMEDVVFEGKMDLLAGVKMKTFTAQATLSNGANTVTVKVDSQVTNFKINLGEGTTPVVPEDPKPIIKPVAVITMTPEFAVTTTTNITWDYLSSTTEVGRSIMATEWEGNQNLYATSGQYTVRLRVQDSTGVWSDWAEKTFIVGKNLSDIWDAYTADAGTSIVFADGVNIATSSGFNHTGGAIVTKEAFARTGVLTLEYDWTPGKTYASALNHYVGITGKNPIRETSYGSTTTASSMFYVFEGGVNNSVHNIYTNSSSPARINYYLIEGKTLHMKVVFNMTNNTVSLYIDDVLVSNYGYNFVALGSEVRVEIGKGIYNTTSLDTFKNISIIQN